MSLRFAASDRSTIGVEWELQIIDPATLCPMPCAPEILAEFAHAHPAHGRIHAEMLRNTLELVSRPRRTVAGFAEDMGIALEGIGIVVEQRRDKFEPFARTERRAAVVLSCQSRIYEKSATNHHSVDVFESLTDGFNARAIENVAVIHNFA